MGTGLKVILVSLVCLQTRFANGAVIKRTGTQLFESVEQTDNNERFIGPEKCQIIPEKVLSVVLGPAFNARYMSVDDPRDNSIENAKRELKTSEVKKRRTNNIPSFFVEEEFNSVFSNEPAWDIEFGNMKYDNQVSEDENFTKKEESDFEGDNREVRRVRSSPWQCNAKVEWVDLGRNYFPRFLRTVECERTNCWHGLYTCKPKSFTVKLLRRQSEICIPSPSIDQILITSNIEVNDSSKKLKELWVWEERAVTFCCECSAGFRSQEKR